MKKLIAVMLTVVLALSLAACGGKKPAEGELGADATMGEKMVAEFNKLMADGTDLADAAAKIAEISEIAADVVEIEPGTEYLNGITVTVDGYTRGVTFRPMIGTIPMAGYLFEADDAEALLKTLQDNCDPRWNICTEAEETVGAVSENVVFFAMLPGEE